MQSPKSHGNVLEDVDVLSIKGQQDFTLVVK
jgi:hypothetical protein